MKNNKILIIDLQLKINTIIQAYQVVKEMLYTTINQYKQFKKI